MAKPPPPGHLPGHPLALLPSVLTQTLGRGLLTRTGQMWTLRLRENFCLRLKHGRCIIKQCQPPWPEELPRQERQPRPRACQRVPLGWSEEVALRGRLRN